MRSWVIRFVPLKQLRFLTKLLLWDQEASEGTVNVRHYGSAKSESYSYDDFVRLLSEDVAIKSRLNQN